MTNSSYRLSAIGDQLVVGTALCGLLLLTGCRTAEAQNAIAGQVNGAPDGKVQFTFAARPGVCGDGRSFVTLDGDTHVGTFTSTESARAACAEGPVRVVIDRAGRTIVALQTFVGPVGATDAAGVTDIGMVDPREASEYLLGLAATLDGRPGRDAVMPASLAQGVDATAQLLAIARDADRPVDTRRSALSWLAREVETPAAAERAAQTLIAMARDAAQPRAMRQQALSVLSRLESGAGIPQVVALTRTTDDNWLASEAVAATARSGDPRARAALREMVERATLPDETLARAIRGLAGQYATAQDAALVREKFDQLPGDRSRATAISAISDIGGEANVSWLIATAKSAEDRTVRRRAVAALARLDDPRVKAALAEIVER